MSDKTKEEEEKKKKLAAEEDDDDDTSDDDTSDESEESEDEKGDDDEDEEEEDEKPAVAAKSSSSSSTAKAPAPAVSASFTKNLWTITKREFAGYFNSALAYIVISASMVLFGLYFFFYQGGIWQIDRASMGRMFDFVPAWICFLTIPLFTMRAMSEEKRLGTIEQRPAERLGPVPDLRAHEPLSLRHPGVHRDQRTDHQHPRLLGRALERKQAGIVQHRRGLARPGIEQQRGHTAGADHLGQTPLLVLEPRWPAGHVGCHSLVTCPEAHTWCAAHPARP